MKDKPNHPLNGFNRLAPFYDRLARLVFGGSIHKSQLALLPFLKGDEHLCMIGGGTGWVLKHYLTFYPQLRVTYIEASSTMIHLAQKHLTPEQACRVRWIHQTHEWLYTAENPLDPNSDPYRKEKKQDPFGRYQGWITFFFLDVLNPEELDTLFHWIDTYQKEHQKNHQDSPQKLQSQIWLFADFCPHSSLWKSALVHFMYWCFRWTTGLKNQKLSDYLTLFEKYQWQEKPLTKKSDTQQKSSALSHLPLVQHKMDKPRLTWAKGMIQSRAYLWKSDLIHSKKETLS